MDTNDTIKSVENALIILSKLKKEKYIDIKDISEILSKSDKECKRYLKTLNKMGIKIVKNKKIYRLLDDNFFEFEVKLDNDDLKILILCKDLLKKNGLHLYADKIKKIIDEFKHVKNIDENDFNESLLLIKGADEEIRNQKVMEIYKNMQKAIDEGFVVSIDYFSAKGEESRRWIYPINIISYDGSIYIKAFCTSKKEYRDFKLIRIENAVIPGPKFDKAQYNKHNMDKSLGFIDSGDTYNIKLKIKRPIAATIDEKTWIKGEKKYWENDCLIYEAEILGDIEIIKWILTMKDCVTILEPSELRDKVKKTLESMMKNI